MSKPVFSLDKCVIKIDFDSGGYMHIPTFPNESLKDYLKRMNKVIKILVKEPSHSKDSENSGVEE